MDAEKRNVGGNVNYAFRTNEDLQEPAEITCEVDVAKHGKKEIYFTVALYWTVFNLGLINIVGPSLIDIQELYHVTTSTSVIVFTCMFAGYLVGAFLAVFVFHRLDDKFYFLFFNGCFTVTLGVATWIPHFAGFCAVLFFCNLFMGLVDTASPLYIMSTWKSHRHLGSMVMMLSVVWTAGGTVASFIVQPFLSEGQPLLTGNEDENNKTELEMEAEQTHVQMGYFVAASLCAVSVVLWCISLCLDGMQLRKQRLSTTSREEISQNRFLKITMLILSFWLYFFYIVAEASLETLLTVYVVEGLHWEKYKGPLITAVYYGAFGVSQIVAVFLTKLATAKTILLSHTCVVCSSVVVLATVAAEHEAVVWVCVVVIGYSSGPFYSGGFLLIGTYVTMDIHLCSAIQCGQYLSAMSMVPATGYILATHGPAAMMFNIAAFSFATLLTLIGIILFAKRFHGEPKRYEESIETENQEDAITHM